MFGASTWPNVIPVAGDWDGDGTDGIGFYCRIAVAAVPCAAGDWRLRNTADAGAPDYSFNYTSPGPSPYPVVGDWNADGTDTIGFKAGTWWYTSDVPVSAVIVGTAPGFVFGGANDLPVVWATVPTIEPPPD